MNQAIAATGKAQKIWEHAPKETKKKIIAALRKSMHEHADDFARRALEETGMGRFEDKVAKKHNSADATPGLEDLETRSWAGDKGLVYEDYAPYGVIAAITFLPDANAAFTRAGPPVAAINLISACAKSCCALSSVGSRSIVIRLSGPPFSWMTRLKMLMA